MSVRPLVDAYLTHLAAEGKTPKTIRWHRDCLSPFAGWMAAAGHPADPDAWSPTLVRRYLLHLRERPKADGRPLSPTSVSSMARSLRAFCAWLVAEELAARTPFDRVKAPAAPRLVKPALSADEVGRLLAAARGQRRNRLRDEAVFLLLLDTVARANEVCALPAAGVDWEGRIAKLYGKGAKERYVPFSVHTAKAMRRYALKERRGGSDRFFESEEGRPLTPSGLLQLCRRLGRNAGVHLSPHKLRHTFAITYLRNGGSAFAVQKMLGHASLDVTLRYASMLTDDLVAEHRDHSPVAGLVGQRSVRRRSAA